MLTKLCDVSVVFTLHGRRRHQIEVSLLLRQLLNIIHGFNESMREKQRLWIKGMQNHAFPQRAFCPICHRCSGAALLPGADFAQSHCSQCTQWVSNLLIFVRCVTLGTVFLAISVTSSVKMAEPELNVDSLISRLLEGWLRFTDVIFIWHGLRDGVKSTSNVVVL